MLSIEFMTRDETFDDEQVLRMAARYFDVCNEPEWLKDEIIREIVRDIDQSELEGLRVVSPILGDISVRDLSGGCKTLICMYNIKGAKILSHELGDNCFKWVMKIAEKQDVTLVYSSIFELPKECEPFNVRIVNDNSVIHDMGEFWPKKFQFYKD